MIFNKEDSYELSIRGGNTLQIGLFPALSISNNGWLNTNTVIPQMEWMHVVLKYDGQYVVAYTNNKSSQPIEIRQVNKSTYPLLIGQRSKYGSSLYGGIIDDIRIYNRALTPAEIQQLYQTTDTKINQPPLAMFTTSATQGAAPFTVNLDASASSDTDGSISRYEWHSSDGQMVNGNTAALIFNNAGEYSITLTVTDEQGATSQAVKSIMVTEEDNGGVVITEDCTNGTITDCRARYDIDNLGGKLCVPCVVVPGAFGTSQIFALDMLQMNPLSLAFEVDPLTLRAHTDMPAQDRCAAAYSPASGLLNLPCVSVGADSYNVDMQQRPGGLIFDVTGVR
jgi:hypothetical protein